MARNFTNVIIAFILFLSGSNYMMAQQSPGDIDLSFNSSDAGYGDYLGASGRVYSVVKQPDGKILIGGDFTTYNNVSRNRIARLNEDGSLDTSFDPGTGFAGTTPPSVRSITLQPDGKIIVAGKFLTFNGEDRNRIARLNADGSLDTSFDPGTGTSTTASHYIQSVALQPDGKIIIGGLFTEYNGVAKSRIARLNEDGSLDNTFTGTGTSTTVAHYLYSIALQNDGKILIGGNFTSYNGTAINRIARLNEDGSLDNTFDVGTGSPSAVRKITVQPDNKIIVGGEFSSFNGTTAGRIIRLNSDGSIDTDFNELGTGGNSGGVFAIKVLSDETILIGGTFTQYNGVSRNKIARLNADGSLDTSFEVGTGVGTELSDFEIQADGKILIAGSFSSYNSVPRRHVTRLNTNGDIDYTFNPETGINGSVYTTALQSDGKILAGGFFTHVNGAAIRNLVRLHTDGSVDTEFNTGPGPQGTGIIEVITLQPDGKILIGGYFTSYDGVTRNAIARLNADGTLDETFDPGSGASGSAPRINAIAVQPDGKILAGGLFDSFDGGTTRSIVRLNQDGSVDGSFNSGGDGINGSYYVYSIALQDDGKIVIAGDFTSYNGTNAVNVARLHTDGTLDLAFSGNVGTGPAMFGSPMQTYSVAVRPDGKILIAGLFDTYNGTASRSIALLNTDGSLDDVSFSSGTGTSWNPVRSIKIQPDGKIIVGGDFNIYNGNAINRFCRINDDGSFDTSFDPGIGAPATVYSILLQNDGRIIIGGDFTSYNGIGRNHIARVYGTQCVLVEGTDTQTACAGESYTWIDGNTYSENNITATHLLEAAAYGGCDSLVTLNLTFLQPVEGTDLQTICAGESFTWIDGNTYTESNSTATYLLDNGAVNGCDSLVTLNLTVSPSINTGVTATGTILTANFADASYQWIDCDNENTPVAGETAQTFSPAEPGNYAVEITFNNCTEVSACFSVNDLGISDNELNKALMIYPNPADEILTIDFSEEGSFSLTDISGKEIKTGILPSGDPTKLDISKLNSGIYFVKVTDKNNQSITKKIVKK